MRFRDSALYALLALLALGVGVGVARQVYAPDTSKSHAPESLWTMHLPDQMGAPHTLSQWRGKVLVLNFWATWCAPCREEIPDFIALRARYQARNVEILGIAMDAPAPVKAYATEMKIPYPVLIGEGAALELARALGNTSGALPYTIVIDPTGKILHRHLGRLSRDRLEAILAPIATLPGAS